MKIIWRLIKWLLVLFFVSAIAFGVYWLYLQSQQGSLAWALKPGIYQGQLPSSILEPSSQVAGLKTVPIIFDYSQPPKLIVIIKNQQVRPLVVDLSVIANSGSAENKLIIKSKQQRLEFESPVRSPLDFANFRKYSGRVKNLDTGEQFDWLVEPSDSMTSAQAGDLVAENFLLWYGYLTENEEVSKSIKATEIAVEQRQQEINELDLLIGNKDQLEQYVDQRLKELRQQTLDLQQQLVSETKIHEELAVEVLSAQNVSQKGRLVNLSRELLQREADLYRLKTKQASLANKFDPNLLKKGARVKQLLAEIASEQAQINNLTAIPAGMP